jgi:hypothetical protein
MSSSHTKEFTSSEGNCSRVGSVGGFTNKEQLFNVEMKMKEDIQIKKKYIFMDEHPVSRDLTMSSTGLFFMKLPYIFFFYHTVPA